MDPTQRTKMCRAKMRKWTHQIYLNGQEFLQFWGWLWYYFFVKKTIFNNKKSSFFITRQFLWKNKLFSWWKIRWVHQRFVFFYYYLKKTFFFLLFTRGLAKRTWPNKNRQRREIPFTQARRMRRLLIALGLNKWCFVVDDDTLFFFFLNFITLYYTYFSGVWKMLDELGRVNWNICNDTLSRLSQLKKNKWVRWSLMIVVSLWINYAVKWVEGRVLSKLLICELQSGCLWF